MTAPGPTLDVARAVAALTRALRKASVPNSSVCELDGCLLISGEPCPACRVRTRPPLCGCGRQIHSRHGRRYDRCYTCRTKPARRPVCACGRTIRAAGQDTCSPCRKQSRNTPADHERPFRWVRHGLIWRPVYDQSEVA